MGRGAEVSGGYYREVPSSDVNADGFSRRVVAQVRCGKCGAERGQWCRTVDGHERASIIFIHKARRRSYLEDLTGATADHAPGIPTSPVVGSIVFVVPIDKQAAWVVSKGAQWARSGAGWRSPGPISTRPVPDDMPSMIGKSRGKLRCVGLSRTHAGRSGNGGAAAWICRCLCGYYVLRTTKALRSEAFDCCDVCNRDIQLARRYEQDAADA